MALDKTAVRKSKNALEWHDSQCPRQVSAK